MKKLFAVLFLLLMVSPAMAQEWPDLGSEQVLYQDAVEIQMYLEDMNDRQPWSAPSPVGEFFYLGTLTFDVCDDVNIAFLDFHTRAIRDCSDPPWGQRGVPACYFMNPMDINYNPSPQWLSEANGYVSMVEEYFGTEAVVFVVDETGINGVMYLGVLQLIDDVVVGDNDYTWYKFVVEPFTAEERLPRPRRPKRRVGR